MREEAKLDVSPFCTHWLNHCVLGHISLREGEKKYFAKWSPLDQGTCCSRHNHIWRNACVDKWWTRRTTSRAENALGASRIKLKVKHIKSKRGSARSKYMYICLYSSPIVHSGLWCTHSSCWWECLECIWRLPSVVVWVSILCFCRFVCHGCVLICHNMKVLLLSVAGSGPGLHVISSKGIKGIMSSTANTWTNTHDLWNTLVNFWGAFKANRSRWQYYILVEQIIDFLINSW